MPVRAVSGVNLPMAMVCSSTGRYRVLTYRCPWVTVTRGDDPYRPYRWSNFNVFYALSDDRDPQVWRASSGNRENTDSLVPACKQLPSTADQANSVGGFENVEWQIRIERTISQTANKFPHQSLASLVSSCANQEDVSALAVEP